MTAQTQTGHGPRIKTYVAESVPQAMTLARREMGDDAILIQTQRRETVDPAKRFEVTFGIVPGAGPAPQQAKLAAKPAISEASTDAGMETEVARELGSLRRELISLQIMLRQSSFGKSNGPQNNDAAYEAYAVLLGNDIDEELASELIRLIEPNSKSPADAVRSQLATQIHTDSTVAQDGKAVVLMGPPASGKTTALIKLAVEYGLKLGNPIEIFSLSKGKANVDRTLEAMTAILGVPCEALPNAAALGAALDRPRAAGTLVLVDTNGYGTSAADEEMELASVLVSGEKADVHLVLSAAWHRVSIRQTVDNFEIFQPPACCSRCWIRPRFSVPSFRRPGERRSLCRLSAAEKRAPPRCAPPISDGSWSACTESRGKPSAPGTNMHPVVESAKEAPRTLTTQQREDLILESMPLVYSIAKRMIGGLPAEASFEDLVSAGTVGLIHAIDNFDSGYDAKLSTYAAHRIRGAMLDSIRSSDWIPRRQRAHIKRLQNAIENVQKEVPAPERHGAGNRRGDGHQRRGVSRNARRRCR